MRARVHGDRRKPLVWTCFALGAWNAGIAAAPIGCTKPQQSPPPASQPVALVDEGPNPISPESREWSAEQALAKLADEGARLSAAVRLVQLSDVRSMAAPSNLTAVQARALRVVAIDGGRFVLGRCDPTEPRRLFSPVLLGPDGTCSLLLQGIEEEVGSIVCSDDPEVFPHVLISPHRVYTLLESVKRALTGTVMSGAYFDLRRERGYPYLALVWSAGGQEAPSQPVEVARYTWDPYELMFYGPASDRLPSGARFELSLKGSPALQPVGGEIAKPEEDMPSEPLDQFPN